MEIHTQKIFLFISFFFFASTRLLLYCSRYFFLYHHLSEGGKCLQFFNFFMRSYNAIGSEIHEGKFENMRMTVVFIDYLFVLEIFIFSE